MEPESSLSSSLFHYPVAINIMEMQAKST